MMIFYIVTILIIFQLGTIICRNFPPNNELRKLNLCHSRSNISKPYSFNCTHFIECDQGNKVIKACAPATVFDPENGICNWPYNVPQCSSVFGHENSIEESNNQYNDKLENTLNPIPSTIPDQPQWNINQNQQPAEFAVSPPPPPSQYGNQNSEPQPNPLTMGNENGVQNNLILKPAPFAQSPYYDPFQKSIFNGEQYVPIENQQNGNIIHKSERNKNTGYRPISFAIDNSNRLGNKLNSGQSGQSFVNNNQNYLSTNHEKQSTGNGQKYQYQSQSGKKPPPQKSNNQYLSNGHWPIGNEQNHDIVFKEYQKDGKYYFVPQPIEDQSQRNNQNYPSIYNGLEEGYEHKEKLPQKENFSGYESQVQSNDRFLPVNYKPDYEQNLVDGNKNKNHQFNPIDSKNNNKQFKNKEEDDDEREDIDIRIDEKSSKNAYNSIST